jgi:hypothetical protein
MKIPAETIATANAEMLEGGLRGALKRHIGYIPEPEQMKQRAHCIILPDNTHCFCWDGLEFYRHKFSLQHHTV